MRLAWAVMAVALSGCVDAARDESPTPFTYAVWIGVPESVTVVAADGEPVEFATPTQVRVMRSWPSYDAALASTAIEFTFFAGDAVTHTGHARPGACVTAPLNCPSNLITHEGIGIYDFMAGDAEGNYLDFDVGTYTELQCEGCGRGFSSTP